MAIAKCLHVVRYTLVHICWSFVVIIELIQEFSKIFFRVTGADEAKINKFGPEHFGTSDVVILACICSFLAFNGRSFKSTILD